MWSWLLRNANIIDGTGRPPFLGDLAVEGDRIAAVAPRLEAGAAQTVDLRGRFLAPGFIDIHSHADFISTLDSAEQGRLQRGKIFQGITTEIVGNCGLGAAPLDGQGLVPKIMAWMCPAATHWTWKSTPEYLDAIETQGVLLNTGLLQPHGPLRLEARGLQAGESTGEERARMKWRLAEALEAGAFGLSSGLIYPPGMYTSPQELIDLAAEGGRRDRIFTSHIRGSSELLLEATRELLEIGREAAVHVHHSHNEAVGRQHWSKIDQVLDLETAAASGGQAVTFDMFPYTAAATTMLAIYPPWSLQGGVARLVERLKNPTERRRIERDIRESRPHWPPWDEDGWPHNLVAAVGWEQIVVGRVASAANKHLEGVSLRDLGEKTARSPFDAISDLMIEEDGLVSQLIFEVSGDENNDGHLVDLMRHPLSAICTDANDYGHGLPHPAAYGAFTRILATYARDRGVLLLEEAIRKMTSYPAEIFKLDRRGRIAEGSFADLVIFDLPGLAEQASYKNPRETSQGIEMVFINGVPVLRDGKYDPRLVGHVLRAS